MKILQVIPYFYPAWAYGGSVRVAYELSKELVNRGHDVTIYTTDALARNSTQKSRFLNVNGIKVRYFKNISNTLAWRHKIFVSPGMLSIVKEGIRQFDIIHLHEYRTFQNIIIHHYAKKYGIPYVLQAHGSLPRIIAKQFFKKLYDMFWGYKLLRDADGLIAISEEEINQYKETGIINEKLLFLIYNGINAEKFKNLPNYGQFKQKYYIEGKMILYLGRINKTKGVDFLVKTFSRLVREIDKEISLVIAGPDDGDKKKIEKMIESLNLGDKVKFTDYLNEKDKLSAYVDADLFVHTVRYMGGVGITPLEAILSNTPVIVTEECGEIIEKANAGYFVKYGDVEGLKDNILEAFGHPEDCKRMVESGKKYIVKNLSWDNVAKQMTRVYSNALDANAR